MRKSHYNNIGVSSFALVYVLMQSKELSLAKLLLVYPFVSHKELLSYLGNSNASILSIEQLIIQKPSFFSNFNKRYYSHIPLFFNSIQYLYDAGYIDIRKSSVILKRDLPIDSSLGKRVNKIYKGSENLSLILEESASILYLNLRVEL